LSLWALLVETLGTYGRQQKKRSEGFRFGQEPVTKNKGAPPNIGGTGGAKQMTDDMYFAVDPCSRMYGAIGGSGRVYDNGSSFNKVQAAMATPATL